MTTHHMRLHPVPFSWIADGNKTVEARVYDEKRQKTQLGDTIIFRQVDDESRTIETKVIGLLRYETFGDMFAHNDVKKFGGDDPESMTEGMLQYYGQREQDEHGVVGIEFSVVL